MLSYGQYTLSKWHNLVEMTVIFIRICFFAPNFMKIGHFLIEMWRGNDFKIAAVCHLGFSKFTVDGLYTQYPRILGHGGYCS